MTNYKRELSFDSDSTLGLAKILNGWQDELNQVVVE